MPAATRAKRRSGTVGFPRNDDTAYPSIGALEAMWGFGRRDTALMASSVGGLAVALVVAAGPGILGFGGWRLMSAALAVGLGLGGLVVWLRRGFPRDVPLVWLGAAEQAVRVASPVPVDRAMLCVVLRRSWASRYRSRYSWMTRGSASCGPAPPSCCRSSRARGG